MVNQWAVIDNDDAEFILEEFRHGPQQIMMVHLALKRPCTPKLLKRMLNTWNVFTKHVTCPLFTCSTHDDAKWRHFISLFGFKPFTEIIWSDGTRRRLYWHGNDEVHNNYKLGREHQLDRHLLGAEQSGSVPDTVSDASVRGSERRTGAIES